MIARSWTARASRAGAGAYAEFFARSLVPELDLIVGHRGALLLTRESDSVDGTIEITVLTFWDALEAVIAFAGSSFERAVVEPEARAVLASFDELVRHHDVKLDSRPSG